MMPPEPDRPNERLTNRYHLMRATIYRILSDDEPGTPRYGWTMAAAPSAGTRDEIPPVAGTSTAHARPPGGATLAVRTTPYVVLIVDDDEDTLETHRSCIEEAFPNVRVRTATSGREALQWMAKGAVDLIITDYKMPDMDGFEFLTLAERLAPQVARIVVTGYAVDVPSVSAELFHVRHFLSKPFRASDLTQAVAQELSTRSG